MDPEAFERLMNRLDVQDERAARRHEQLMDRGRRDMRLTATVLSDIDLSIKASTDRLDDMQDEIRANTRAVLSVLDRLEPGSA